jgi:hypothetical protein
MASSDFVRTNYILVGPHAGKTITLGNRFNFVKGSLPWAGDGDAFVNVSKLMETYQAYPQDHPKVAEASNGKRTVHVDGKNTVGSKQVEGGVQSDKQIPSEEDADNGGGTTDSEAGSSGNAGSGGNGPGSADETVDPEIARIKTALLTLDVNDDTHWTKNGEPTIEVVAGAANVPTLVRKQIKLAYPGFNRELAASLKETK